MMKIMVTMSLPITIMFLWRISIFYQIQDIDETVSDSSQTGSSSSLSALDVNEKQLKCPNLPDIADTVLFSFFIWPKCSIVKVMFHGLNMCTHRRCTDDGYSCL